MEWIKIDKYEPKTTNVYLVTIYINGHYGVDIDEYNEITHKWAKYRFNVVAWMDLPAPCAS